MESHSNDKGPIKGLKGILAALHREASKHDTSLPCGTPTTRTTVDARAYVAPMGFFNSLENGLASLNYFPDQSDTFQRSNELQTPEFAATTDDVSLLPNGDADDGIEVLVCGRKSSGELQDLLDLTYMSQPITQGLTCHKKSQSTPHLVQQPTPGVSFPLSEEIGPPYFLPPVTAGDPGLLPVCGQEHMQPFQDDGHLDMTSYNADIQPAAFGFGMPTAQQGSSQGSAAALCPPKTHDPGKSNKQLIVMEWDFQSDCIWKHRMHDVSAWFNYGFTDSTFKEWLQGQIDARGEQR